MNLEQRRRAERTAKHRVNQVVHLYERYRKRGVGEEVMLTFTRALRSEFPLATVAEIQAMASFVEARHAADSARLQKAALRWSADEKRALVRLFRLVDTDGSGSISLQEFEELARLASLRRSELRDAFERASECGADAGRREGSGDLLLPEFLRVVEGLSMPSLMAIRSILPGLLLDEKRKSVTPTQFSSSKDDDEGANKEGLGGSSPTETLIFDDGRQQLWKLSRPGSGRGKSELVRRDTIEAEWRAALQ